VHHLGRVTGVLIAVVLAIGTATAINGGPTGDAAAVDARALERAPLPTTTTTTTTTTTEPPATTTEPPTTALVTAAVAAPVEPPAPAPEPPPAPVRTGWTFDPYVGLGMWVDVYDWSAEHGGSAVGIADMDRMAALGVQTVFIQTARADTTDAVLERPRLLSLIDRAHADGMRVVGWYLPYHEDPGVDLDHLMGIASLPVDGLAVDIESTKEPDVAVRNQRLVDLSAALRAQLPDRVLSAIVLPPVVTDVLNLSYWPDFPWQTLAQYYDLWQPMGYFTNRRADSPYRNAYTYTAENIDRIRAHLDNPDAVVHPIGGIGDQTTVDDVYNMLEAARERGCIGGGLYDYRTTDEGLYAALQGFRA
jgi:hypothetical protein